MMGLECTRGWGLKVAWGIHCDCLDEISGLIFDLYYNWEAQFSFTMAKRTNNFNHHNATGSHYLDLGLLHTMLFLFYEAAALSLVDSFSRKGWALLFPHANLVTTISTKLWMYKLETYQQNISVTSTCSPSPSQFKYSILWTIEISLICCKQFYEL